MSVFPHFLGVEKEYRIESAPLLNQETHKKESGINSDQITLFKKATSDTAATLQIKTEQREKCDVSEKKQEKSKRKVKKEKDCRPETQYGSENKR